MDTAPVPDPPSAGERVPAGAARTGVETLTPLRELQLVENHQAGDPDALGELLAAYQRRIYAVCYRMVRNPEEAADLTQDSMIKIMEGLAGYEARARLSTWIIRITMNCCLSHLRREKLRRHASLDDDAGREGDSRARHLASAGELSAAERVERSEMHALLLRSLAGLDPEMRAVLVLRDLQQLDYLQIGEVLNVPIGTVKSRLFRARLALRELVERGVEGDRDDDDRRTKEHGS